MVPFSFAGETFEATASGALFWPAREALLFADLHLEKASWFARLGQFLPPYDSHATLTALAAEVERSGAKRLYCLGDSFHDAFGCDRLSRERTRVADRADHLSSTGSGSSATTIPDSPIIAAAQSRTRWKSAGSYFATRRCPANERPEISGHFHPEASAAPPRTPGLTALLRTVGDEAHHARVRSADRRA